MYTKLLRAALLLMAFLLPSAALAQQRVLPGGLRLAGYWATCGPVETTIQKFNDIAASYGGTIILNPRLFALPRAQQMFWYTHECSHHIFGPSEEVADCWSVEQGRIQGWLNAAEFEALEVRIRVLPGDSSHANGPARAAYMSRCYNR